MLKSRFRRELDGDLGPRWAQNARNDILRVQQELESGEITIDGAGVVRNCIGRAVTEEVLEILSFVTDKFDIEATNAARIKEDREAIEEYRKAMANHQPSEEELLEMRAAFGEGTSVVNILTGESIQL